MEFLLLWADELDDAIGALRHLAPRLLGLAVALLLFAATGFALVLAPDVALATLTVLLSGSLLESLRRRRAHAATVKR